MSTAPARTCLGARALGFGAAVLAAVLLWQSPQAAALPNFYCRLPPSGSGADSLVTIVGSNVTAVVHPEDGGAAVPLQVVGARFTNWAIGGVDFLVDASGDGVGDAWVRLRLKAFWSLKFESFRLLWNYSAAEALEQTVAGTILAEEFGVAYPWTASPPPFVESFRKMYVAVGLIGADLPGSTPVPAGRIELDVNIRKILPAPGSPQFQTYGFWLDSSGAGAPRTRPAWPHHFEVGAFLDASSPHIGLAMQSRDASGAITPWDSLRAGFRMPQVKEVSLGYDAAADAAHIGFPGDSAVVAHARSCTAVDGLRADVVVGHRAPSGGGVPTALSARVVLSDPAERDYMDMSLSERDPAQRLRASLSQHDADVDGDGTPDSGDYNLDGYRDFPTDRFTFTHSPDAEPSLRAVVAMTNPEAPGHEETYIAAEAVLPPTLAVDVTGAPRGYDVDGDGYIDFVRDLDRIDARACPGAWGSAECSAAAGVIGDVRVAAGSRVPAPVGGVYPAEFSSLGVVPPELAAPHPASWARMDVDGDSWSLAAELRGLRHVGLDLTGGMGATVDGVFPGAFALRYTDGGGAGGPATDAATVLDALPAHAQVALDSADVAADGDPVSVAYDLGTALTARTSVARTGPGIDARALGTIVVPGTAALEMALDNGPADSAVRWRASAAAAADLGVAARLGAAPTVWAHAAATVPAGLAVSWADDASRFEADTCDAGVCGPVDVQAVGGVDPARPVDATPLAVPFGTFPGERAPEIAATEADHFTTAGVDRFLTASGDAAAGVWSGAAHLPGVQRVSFAAEAAGAMRVHAETDATGRVGLSGEVATTGMSASAWAVLDALPAGVDVRYTPAGGVAYGLTGTPDVAFTTDVTTGDMTAAAAGWIDDVPAAVSASWGENAGVARYTFDAAAPMGLDVGASVEVGGDVLYGHLQGDVPGFLALVADSGAGSVTVDTCRAPGDCSPFSARLRGGVEPAGTVGYWPLLLAFDAGAWPEVVPAEIAATQAGRFDPAGVDKWVILDGDVATGQFTVDANLPGTESATYTAAPDAVALHVDTSGAPEFGVLATVRDGGARAARAWIVLDHVPDTFDLTFGAGGGARLQIADPVTAAVTLDATDAAAGLDFAAAGWVEDVPADLSVDVGAAAVTYTASGPARIDMGASLAVGAPAPLWAHVDVTVAEYLSVAWGDGDFAATTCATPGNCAAAAVDAVGGVDTARATGYWPLLEAVPDAGGAPAEILLSAPGHFAPTAADHVAVAGTVGGDWRAGGRLGALRRVAFGPDAATGGLGVTVDNDGAPLGLAADVATGAGPDATTVQAWGVLAAAPADFTFAAAGDAVAFDSPARTGAALAAHITSGGPGGTEAYAAGWIGTGAGATDGLVPAGRLDVASGPTGIEATWTAADAVAFDLGFWSGSPGAGQGTWGRAAGSVPPYLRATLPADGSGGGVTTCPAPDACTAATLDFTVGADATTPPGYGALLAPFPAFDFMPAEILATAAAHFGPGPASFVDLYADVDSFHAGGRVADVAEATVTRTGARLDATLRSAAGAGDQLGVEADLRGADGSRTELWTVLADRPDVATVSVLPQRYAWDLTAGTPAALAASFTAVGVDAQVAGWADMPAGGYLYTGTDDLGSGTTEGRVVWGAATPADLDLGLAARTAGATSAFAHVRSAVPSRLEVNWRSDPVSGGDPASGVAVGFDTCDSGGCSPLHLEATAGQRQRAPGFWALLEDLPGTLGAAPGALTATAADHFPPAADDFARLAGDPQSGDWTGGARIAGVEAAGFYSRVPALGDPAPMFVGLHADTVGGRPLGFAMDGVDVGAATGDLFGVFSAVPDTIDVSVGEHADGSVVHWEAAQPIGAGFAGTLAEGGATTEVAGWLGTGDGAADGVPSSATLDMKPAADGLDLDWEASNAVAVDVAGRHDAGDRPFWAHLRALVPAFARVHVDGGGAAFDACRESDCPALDLGVAAGADDPLVPAPHPLARPFATSFDSPAPAALVATAGGHFDPATPAATDFARVTGDLAGAWTADAVLTGITGAALAVGEDAGTRSVEVGVDRNSPEWDPVGRFGVAADVVVGDPGGERTRLQAWGVLAATPRNLDVAYRDETLPGGLHRYRAGYGFSGLAAVGAALAAEFTTTDASVAQVAAGAGAAWFGTGDGATDGIPGSLDVVYDESGADDPAVAVAEYTAPGATRVDAGFSFQAGEASTSPIAYGRLVATIPGHVRVHYPQGDGPGAEETSGVRVVACTPAEVLAGCEAFALDALAGFGPPEVLGAGRDTVGYWPLSEEVHPPRPVPAALAGAAPAGMPARHVSVTADAACAPAHPAPCLPADVSEWGGRVDVSLPPLDEVAYVAETTEPGGDPSLRSTRHEVSARLRDQADPDPFAVDVVVNDMSDTAAPLALDAYAVAADLPPTPSLGFTQGEGRADFDWDLGAPLDAGVVATVAYLTDPGGGAGLQRPKAALAATATLPASGVVEYRAVGGGAADLTAMNALHWGAASATPVRVGVSYADLPAAAYSDPAAVVAAEKDQVAFARLETAVPRELNAVFVQGRADAAAAWDVSSAVAATCTATAPIDAWLPLGLPAVDGNDCDDVTVEALGGGVFARELFRVLPYPAGTVLPEATEPVGYWPLEIPALGPGPAPAALAETQGRHFPLPTPDAVAHVAAATMHKRLGGAVPETEAVTATAVHAHVPGLRSFRVLGTGPGARRATLGLAADLTPFVVSADTVRFRPDADPTAPLPLLHDRAWAALDVLPAAAPGIDLAAAQESDDTGEVLSDFVLGWDFGGLRPALGMHYDRAVEPANVAALLAEFPDPDPADDVPVPRDRPDYSFVQAAAWAGSEGEDPLPSAGSLKAETLTVGSAPIAAALRWDSPATETVAVEAAFSQTSIEDEAAAWWLEGRTQFTFPSHADVLWVSDPSGAGSRLDLSACRDPAACTESERLQGPRFAGRYSRHADRGDRRPPLAAYPALPVAPTHDLMPAVAPPDFDAPKGFVHAVDYNDPQGSVHNGTDRRRVWGAAASLPSVSAVSLERRRRAAAGVAMDTTQVCADTEFLDPRFDAFVFSGTPSGISLDAAPQLYADVHVTRTDTAGVPTPGPVGFSVGLNVPVTDTDGDGDADRALFDYGSVQAESLRAAAAAGGGRSGDYAPLAEYALRGCHPDTLLDPERPALADAPPLLAGDHELHVTGIVRQGTLGDGAQRGLNVTAEKARHDMDTDLFDFGSTPGAPVVYRPLPTGRPGGVDVAVLTEDYAGTESGLQAALNWRVPRYGVVAQPVVATCGEGSQRAVAAVVTGLWPHCGGELLKAPYDDEVREVLSAWLDFSPPVQAEAGLGELSLTLVGDAPQAGEGNGAPDVGDGRNTVRHVFVDRVPNQVRADLSTTARERDNRLDLHADVHQQAGATAGLGKVMFRGWDELTAVPVSLVPTPANGWPVPAPGLTHSRNSDDVPQHLFVLTNVPSDVALDARLSLGTPKDTSPAASFANLPGDQRCFQGTPKAFPVSYHAGDQIHVGDVEHGVVGPTVHATETITGSEMAAPVAAVDAWATDVAPRGPESARPMYVHGSIDLAGDVRAVDFALGLHGTRRHDSSILGGVAGYDGATGDLVVPVNLRATGAGGAPAPFDGSLRVLVPNLVVPVHVAPPALPYVPFDLYRADICFDVDLPVDLAWTDVSDLSLLSNSARLQMEQEGPGTTTLRFRERVYREGATYAPDALPHGETPGVYHHAAWTRLMVPQPDLSAPSLLSRLGLAATALKRATNRAHLYQRRVNSYAPIGWVEAGTVFHTPFKIPGVMSLALPAAPTSADPPADGTPIETGGSGPDSRDVAVNPVMSPDTYGDMSTTIRGELWQTIWGFATRHSGHYDVPAPAAADVAATPVAGTGAAHQTFTTRPATVTNAVLPALDRVADEHEVGTLGDGTRLLARTVFGRNGTVELWLVGEYPGPRAPLARFAKLVAAGKGCFGTQEPKGVRLEFEFGFGQDETTGTFQVDLRRASFQTGTGEDAASWTPSSGWQTMRGLWSGDGTYDIAEQGPNPPLVGDVSGDMGYLVGSSLAFSAAVPLRTGEDVVFDVPNPGGALDGLACHLLPGDGRRIDVAAFGDQPPLRYRRAGPYEPLVVCYVVNSKGAGVVVDGPQVTVAEAP